MSLTLGEKLRQAREAKGIPISEVAEQTRIAPLYIESIDNDDYRALPGGIFNRGFVKSYAKYVGVDEQEALMDYARLLNDTEGNDVEEVKTYKPQVLTDDHATSSIVPTLIGAVVILGIMIGGILFLVRYLSEPDEPHSQPKTNITTANINSPVEDQTPAETPAPSAPEMATVKVEFKAVNESVSLMAVVDDNTSTNEIMSGTIKVFEPKKGLKLSYARSKAEFVQLAINGKPITLPSAPINPRRPAVIEFDINKDNLERIWTSGMITAENPSPLTPVTFSPKPQITAERPKPAANASVSVPPKPTGNTMKPANRPIR